MDASSKATDASTFQEGTEPEGRAAEGGLGRSGSGSGSGSGKTLAKNKRRAERLMAHIQDTFG